VYPVACRTGSPIRSVGGANGGVNVVETSDPGSEVRVEVRVESSQEPGSRLIDSDVQQEVALWGCIQKRRLQVDDQIERVRILPARSAQGQRTVIDHVIVSANVIRESGRQLIWPKSSRREIDLNAGVCVGFKAGSVISI
jgi:hypothetical protein